MSASDNELRSHGAISWMGRNAVASNLFMLMLVAGGLVMANRIKQEVFPEVNLETISVQVPYPGASPEEVEKGILLAIEEAVRGIDDVKRVKSTALENMGVVVIELQLSADVDRALSDVKSQVDRIVSFPQDAERPVISQVKPRQEVISLVIYGDLSERALRALAERSRDDLLQDPNITQIEIYGTRPPEIAVEVPAAQLRAHGLTLEQVSGAVAMSSVELPGGGIKTATGELLLRTDERRDVGREFEDIVLAAGPSGAQLRLGDIATVDDGFRETEVSATFNGQPAAMVRVFRVGEQTPIDVSDAVHDYIERTQDTLPPGVRLAFWNDQSEIYRDRIDLLLRNAKLGLFLVLLVLGLFLEPRLAFWVTLGIPISFLGSMIFLPGLETSINMISLFAFIVTLGMVVDDAIVVGENVYKKRQEGMDLLPAAIEGAKEVAMPVTFSILTSIVAFMPMFMVPGAMGKFFRVVPAVVVSVLTLSLVESLFILPAHLAHSAPTKSGGILGRILHFQQAISRGLERFIQGFYARRLRESLKHRYLSIALGTFILLAALSLPAGGRLLFTFMPKIEGDIIFAQCRLPYGAAVEESHALRQRLVDSATAVLDENGGDALSRGVYAQVGEGLGIFDFMAVIQPSGSHVVDVAVFLVPSDQRTLSSREFTRQWRERVGTVPGVESMVFDFNLQTGVGKPIDVQLSHDDVSVLEAASSRLAKAVASYSGVTDIDDGFTPGKRQLDFRLRPGAKSYGLSEAELGRQIRSAFYGAEALRQQRGRDEIRVMVRLPESDRRSEHTLEQMLVRSSQGGDVPLGRVATVERGRAYDTITRVDGRRVVNVTAEVDASLANPNVILADLEEEALPELLAAFPGMRYSLEGEQRDQRESMGGLGAGYLLALLLIYALLAIPFRSYTQPLIVMSVIPFGLVGAIGGHLIMGYGLSLMSIMGIVALSGIVVNDSLVLIVAVNRLREEGMTPFEAVHEGCLRRFRPILLTSLTTFFGLVPMIFETSMQARFLIPMALSLGFGVLFATVMVLVLVPSVYLVLEDLQSLKAWVWGAHKEPEPLQLR